MSWYGPGMVSDNMCQPSLDKIFDRLVGLPWFARIFLST